MKNENSFFFNFVLGFNTLSNAILGYFHMVSTIKLYDLFHSWIQISKKSIHINRSNSITRNLSGIPYIIKRWYMVKLIQYSIVHKLVKKPKSNTLRYKESDGWNSRRNLDPHKVPARTFLPPAFIIIEKNLLLLFFFQYCGALSN